MKTSILVFGFLAVAMLASAPARAELGLAPPATHIIVKFVFREAPQEGVTAVLVDGDNREHQLVSEKNGSVEFTFQAKSGNAFLTFWKEGAPAVKKVIPYMAGNHYRLRLELPE